MKRNEWPKVNAMVSSRLTTTVSDGDDDDDDDNDDGDDNGDGRKVRSITAPLARPSTSRGMGSIHPCASRSNQ